ncbi:hypothetical protein B0I35DRAFT_481060 [Stachybotrys elegans]|uniref:Uncharacterized protein n=1 Tax=Stachybotrys elegans TaxID=80388 RepID=A0A8K0WNU2_9HYPO|nr:hypothetical protein B0I35DRAFT_481060 [Stachybotrys elegans]
MRCKAVLWAPDEDDLLREDIRQTSPALFTPLVLYNHRQLLPHLQLQKPQDADIFECLAGPLAGFYCPSLPGVPVVPGGRRRLLRFNLSTRAIAATLKISNQACGETPIEAFDQSLFTTSDKSKNWATEHVIEARYTATSAMVSKRTDRAQDATCLVFSGVSVPWEIAWRPGSSTPISVEHSHSELEQSMFACRCGRPRFQLQVSHPNNIVFECLGSKPQPISASVFAEWLNEAIGDPSGKTDGALHGIRKIIGIWAYLLHDEVVAAIDDIQDCLSTTFTTIETLCPAFAPSMGRGGIREYWVLFDRAYWDASVEHCKASADNYLALLERRYTQEYQAGTPGIANVYARVMDTVDDLVLDLDLFKRPNTPPT